jgi:LPS-assembly lipoprotein
MTRPGPTLSAGVTRRAALLSGIGAMLTGCGFHPVYSSSGTGTGPQADLAAIDVKPIYERPGQLLREALLSDLRIEPGAPRHFDLNVNYWVEGESISILDFTQATRVRITGHSTWNLMSHDPKPIRLLEGSERLVDGLDIFENQYFAMDMDVEKVERRMAETMAERITLRLAAWFHQHPSPTA